MDLDQKLHQSYAKHKLTPGLKEPWQAVYDHSVM